MTVSEAEIEAALQACADEPVHIPGIIQPVAWLLAYDAESGEIGYASQNAESLFGEPAVKLLGRHARDLFGSEIWHALQNARAPHGDGERRIRAGQFALAGRTCEFNAFESGQHVVIEIEPVDETTGLSPEALHELGFLIDAIQACSSQAVLFETAAKLLQIFSGYDRVMIYQFDRDFNGEVLAEARRPAMEPMLGLRFPHWDIPAQARAIMLKLPLRFIADVNHEPVQILAASSVAPDLDITHAYARGVSKVHMQYLRNMGTAATMTLSVVLDGQLWGIISFHHRRARTPAPQVRHVLQEFLKAFQLKLSLLRERLVLKAGKTLEAINAQIHDQRDAATVEQIVADVGPKILELIGAHGVALLTGSQSNHLGSVPDKAVLDQLAKDARNEEASPLVVDHLADRHPGLKDALQGCAGALTITYGDDLVLSVFREEITRSVQWAGNPEKTIETVNGFTRLAPRGSFAVYLEKFVGRSEPWSGQDIYLFKQLWSLLSVADRSAQLARLSRQQALMIDELNHRVRNILALVRAVSNQARAHYGSLNSYSKALEARINALAAVHDIGSGSAATAISVRQVIKLELEPYETSSPDRVRITGPDRSIRADIGPIFALVIHELTTNAAKYGALSAADGQVLIELSVDADEFMLEWRESGGPDVDEPQSRGFGTMLIEQAVPFELGGSSRIDFARDGVRASVRLPTDILASPAPADEPKTPKRLDTEELPKIPPSRLGARILVVEDNFMIAADMRLELERLGFLFIEICSNAADAFDSIAQARPDLALLDVNLGGGETSEALATRLLELGVPFFFITGYGERTHLPAHLDGIARLTKPVSVNEMRQQILDLLTRPSEASRNQA